MNIYRKSRGFTLVELMIVVAIVAVLAGIALPSYQKYIMRGKRGDAKAALSTLQQAQEKYRANCVQYATGINATTRTCDSAGGTFNLVGGTTSPDGHYTLSISAADSTTYTLEAVPVSGGDQASDTDCAKFTINQDSEKKSYNSSNVETDTCWQ